MGAFLFSEPGRFSCDAGCTGGARGRAIGSRYMLVRQHVPQSYWEERWLTVAGWAKAPFPKNAKFEGGDKAPVKQRLCRGRWPGLSQWPGMRMHHHPTPSLPLPEMIPLANSGSPSSTQIGRPRHPLCFSRFNPLPASSIIRRRVRPTITADRKPAKKCPGDMLLVLLPRVLLLCLSCSLCAPSTIQRAQRDAGAASFGAGAPGRL